MLQIKVFYSILLLACCLNFSNNAALSEQELKKYKQFIEGQGLYSIEDDVLILTAQNFKNQVYGKKYTVLVEFYNSWCGFCQRFAPSWKALASDIKSWKSMITIAALDCSDDDNSPICREFEIMAYPTLRYFHENYLEGEGKIGEEVQKGEDMQSHKVKLIKHVINEQRKGRGQIFPNVLPYTYPNLDHLYDDVPADTKYVFLIIEQPDAFVGPEIAFDLQEVSNIAIKYSLNNNTDLIKNLDISKFPSMKVVASDKTITTFTENIDTRENIRTVIKQFLPASIVVPEVTTKKDIYTGKWLDAEVPDMSELMAAREKEELRRRIKTMGDVVFQADLETALRYSLKHDVGNVKSISGEKLAALKQYLDVLHKYFPFGQKGETFLKDLKSLVSLTDTVDGHSISSFVVEAEQEDKQIFSSAPQWLACKGSSATYRGYPCGLWKLFHYLSVNAAEKNANNEDANPREILEAMYGYIKYFFGCSDCSKHFQNMAEERDMSSVSSLDSAIVWLWMAHNQVNKRLASDASEDPEYPKVQFPLAEHCAACRNTDNSWNLQEVLKYMKHVYSYLNLRYIGSDTRILHMGLEGSQVNAGSSTFPTLDASMCFILYVGSFFLIVVLIRMFLKRGYKKKMYVHDLLGKV